MHNDLIMASLKIAKEVQTTTGATRKYSQRPYLTHPMRVMGLMAAHPGVTPLEIAAAILHDVHEDPPFISLDRIRKEVHPQVAVYVHNLTNPSKKFMLPDGKYPKEWNRSRRKEYDQAHLATCDYWTQTAKGYDRQDNVTELLHDLLIGIPNKPPLDFIELYVGESDELASDRVLDKIEPWQREALQKSISLLRSFAFTSR